MSQQLVQINDKGEAAMLTAEKIQTKVRQAGEGETFAMMGITLTPKITREDSQGALSMIEQVVQPGAGSPPHILHQDDKVFYFLEGTFGVLLGEEMVQVGPGAVVQIPRGTVHSFRNVGQTPGKLLAILTPGGHELFLRALSEVVQGGPPNPQAMQAVAGRYHVELLPPKQA